MFQQQQQQIKQQQHQFQQQVKQQQQIKHSVIQKFSQLGNKNKNKLINNNNK